MEEGNCPDIASILYVTRIFLFSRLNCEVVAAKVTLRWRFRDTGVLSKHGTQHVTKRTQIRLIVPWLCV